MPGHQEKQAKLSLSLSASPTLSLSDPNAILSLTVAVSIASTTEEHRKKPLTLCLERTVLQERALGDRGVDVFAEGGFSPLVGANNDKCRRISLGYFHIHRSTHRISDDMRDQGYRFRTVPAVEPPSRPGQSNEEARRTATITHELDWERIFRYADGRSKKDLVPGEVFEIYMSKRFLTTRWWCWGDLESDLKGKKLHFWHNASYNKEKPEVDDSWVLGEDPRELEWEDVTEGGKVSFTIIE